MTQSRRLAVIYRTRKKRGAACLTGHFSLPLFTLTLTCQPWLVQPFLSTAWAISLINSSVTWPPSTFFPPWCVLSVTKGSARSWWQHSVSWQWLWSIRKHCFTGRVMEPLYRCQQEVVNSSSLEISKRCLDMALGNMLYVSSVEQERGWTQWPPEVPSSLKHCVTMWKPRK